MSFLIMMIKSGIITICIYPRTYFRSMKTNIVSLFSIYSSTKNILIGYSRIKIKVMRKVRK
uniref:Uncharacterized protein n=1 Tax=Lepeophtheirus salmonis TaxID=72036 RepID=A0A0K2T6X6_LEPSM